jgi:hypothetical protein
MATYRACAEMAYKLREQAADLETMADWIESEGVKLEDLPWMPSARTFQVWLTDSRSFKDEHGNYQSELNKDATKANIRRFLRAVGSCDKQFENDKLRIRKVFGKTVILEGAVDRSIACKKIVKEKKWVEAQVIQGYYDEKVEWDCETPSLLALVKE